VTNLPVNRWKLGLFVVIGFATMFAALGWLGVQKLEREAIQAYYFFDERVEGLEVGSAIKFRGVPIGRVSEIRIASDQRHVEVVGDVFLDALESIGLHRDPRGPEDGPFVPPELRVQLITSVLTGKGFLQSDFVDLETHPIPTYPFEVPWNTVHTVPSTIEGIEAGLIATLERLPRVLDRAAELLERGETAFDELALGALSQEARQTLSALRTELAELDRLPPIAQATRTLERAEETLGDIQEAVAEVREHARIDETTAVARDLGERLGRSADEVTALAADVRGELGELERLFESLRRLAELLERDPSALLFGSAPRRPTPTSR